MWTGFLIGLAAGLAATPHCLGMCGGFPLYLAKAAGSRRALVGQLLFLTGKGFTYVFLGSLAGAFGEIMVKGSSPGALMLRLTSGLITVVFGLRMLGVRVPLSGWFRGSDSGGFVKTMLDGILNRPGMTPPFLLGLGVGFLPCPLPMGMLAVTAAGHSVLNGMLIMAGVGLGTVPGLLFAGLVGMGLTHRFRIVGMRAAGVLVLAIGLLTITRSTGLLSHAHSVDHVMPPCCSERAR